MIVERLKKRAQDVISGKDSDSVFAWVLSGISGLYGPAMDFRSKLYQKGWMKTRRLPCPVISIGNITLGGTGKTPMTIHMAVQLRSMGLRPAIVCRGYKGKYEHTGGVVSDGVSVFLEPGESGDEPFLMASRLSGVPVAVGKNRYVSGLEAWRSFHPDIIICDDAFQHLRLYRDLNLVLMDAAEPVGNGRIFPKGILREPLKQLERADALIVTRVEKTRFDLDRFRKKINVPDATPVFRCCHVPDFVSVLGETGEWKRCDSGVIRTGTWTAFAGIAGNEDFVRMLTRLGCRVKSAVFFPDHHQFSEKDMENILKTALKDRSQFIVTTEKDAVRLPKKMFMPLKIFSLGIRISFLKEDQGRFEGFVRRRIADTR